MISKSFFEALTEVAEDRGLEIERVLDKVRFAMEKAARFAGYTGEITLDVDYDKKELKVYDRKYVVNQYTVVDEIEDPEERAKAEDRRKYEILVEDAKLIKPKAKAGQEIKTKVEFQKFGRKAAMNFKNSFNNELKILEREEAYKYFSSKVGEVITAKAIDTNERFVTFSIGKGTFASMPLNEIIPGETFTPQESYKVYVNKVEKTTKSPKVFISRNNREFVKRLFEMNIPEISDGSVEIMGISREAGNRTKIGVLATKANIDAKGACVGQGGLRIKGINEILNNEKIDIFLWKDDPVQLIAEALKPAHALSVVIEDEKEKKALVIVSDDQYSLAIGKNGQNVRLAAYAIEWRIDIKTLSAAGSEGIKFTYNVFER